MGVAVFIKHLQIGDVLVLMFNVITFLHLCSLMPSWKLQPGKMSSPVYNRIGYKIRSDKLDGATLFLLGFVDVVFLSPSHLFLSYLKAPSASVASQNASTLFGCRALENICGGINLARLSTDFGLGR